MMTAVAHGGIKTMACEALANNAKREFLCVVQNYLTIITIKVKHGKVQ
jgi:hypothetical protein